MRQIDILEKYRNLFLIMDLDWNGYLCLKKLEKQELDKLNNQTCKKDQQ